MLISSLCSVRNRDDDATATGSLLAKSCEVLDAEGDRALLPDDATTTSIGASAGRRCLRGIYCVSRLHRS